MIRMQACARLVGIADHLRIAPLPAENVRYDGPPRNLPVRQNRTYVGAWEYPDTVKGACRIVFSSLSARARIGGVQCQPLLQRIFRSRMGDVS
jgi:hypothetical protein